MKNLKAMHEEQVRTLNGSIKGLNDQITSLKREKEDQRLLYSKSKEKLQSHQREIAQMNTLRGVLEEKEKEIEKLNNESSEIEESLQGLVQ